jgi:hypothetical protein
LVELVANPLWLTGQVERWSAPHRLEWHLAETLAPGDKPVVLLSAGIGATPLLSMLHSLADGAANSTREIWWCYGTRNGTEHPFMTEARALLSGLSGSHSFVAYSKPEDGDRSGTDYDVSGQSVTRTGAVTSPVYDPSTGQVQAHLEHGDAATLAEAVAAAKAAQPAWAANNPQQRARAMFKFKALIEEYKHELVHLMSSEHGKLLGDSMGELQRGLDVVEFVCGVPHLQKGELTQGAGPGTNVYSIHEPLGVVAGISPFNFPAMIPLWMLAPAIAVGNAFILKPSERTPSAAVRLAELALGANTEILASPE